MFIRADYQVGYSARISTCVNTQGSTWVLTQESEMAIWKKYTKNVILEDRPYLFRLGEPEVRVNPNNPNESYTRPWIHQEYIENCNPESITHYADPLKFEPEGE